MDLTRFRRYFLFLLVYRLLISYTGNFFSLHRLIFYQTFFYFIFVLRMSIFCVFLFSNKPSFTNVSFCSSLKECRFLVPYFLLVIRWIHVTILRVDTYFSPTVFWLKSSELSYIVRPNFRFHTVDPLPKNKKLVYIYIFISRRCRNKIR